MALADMVWLEGSRGPPCDEDYVKNEVKKEFSMEKRRSGPEGPDRAPEPFEIEAPEAALEHDKDNCDCVQPCLEAMFSKYPDALEGVDRDRIVRDSGWDESGDIAVRLVFGEGPRNNMLLEWIRRMAFDGAALPGEIG